MLHRVLILLLAVLFAGNGAADALLECSTIGNWGSRGSSRDFVVRDPFLIAVDGRGIVVYDIRNPSAVRQQTVITGSAPTHEIVAVGSKVVVLTGGGLELYELTAEGSLILLHALSYPAVHIAANSGFVVTSGPEIVVWDVATGRFVSRSRARSSSAQALEAYDAAVFASVGNERTEVYRLAGGELGSFKVMPAPANGFARIENTLLASSGQGLFVIDITNLDQPRILGKVEAGIGDLRNLTLYASALYANNSFHQIAIFDVSNPREPRLVRQIAELPVAMAAAGDRLFVGGVNFEPHMVFTETGTPLRIYDLRDPLNPVLRGEFHDYAGPLAGVATDGEYAYVADPPLFRVIDIRTRRPLEIASLPLEDSSDRVRLEGSVALVYGRGKVHMIFVEDPRRPRLLGIYDSLGLPRSQATFAGPYLIEANRASGFHLVDITNPAAPGQIGGLKNDGYGQFLGVVAMPGYAYSPVAQGIKVISLADPRVPRVVRVIPETSVIDLEIAPATPARPALLVALRFEALRFYDLTSPLDPVEVGSVRVPKGSDLALDGDTAWVVALTGSLTRVDFSNPRNPRVTDEMAGFKEPTQVAAAGGRVVVADRFSLRVLRDPRAVPPSPEALVIRAARHTSLVASIDWEGEAGEYEVQTSSSSDFSSSESFFTSSSSIDLVARAALFVRVRTGAGCSAGGWSNVLSLGAESRSGIFFETSGTHVALPSGASEVVVDIPVQNRSGSPQRVRLMSDVGGGIVLPDELELAPGTRGTVSIRLRPAEAAPVYDLTFADSSGAGQHFRLFVSALRVEAAGGTSMDDAFLAIPGVGATAGANGTRWKSDVHLFCRGPQPCAARLIFHRSAASPRQIVLTLPAGHLMILRDLIGTVFGEQGVMGWLEIASQDVDALMAQAVTYNEGERGRFGQSIPSRRIQPDASKDLRLLTLLGVRADSVARTNIGIVNTTSEVRNLSFELLDSQGLVREFHRVEIGPRQSQQNSVVDFFGVSSELTAATIRITAPRGVVIYGSRVDQITGDGVFSYAEENIEDKADQPMIAVIDAAGSLEGAGGSQWRTALQLVNTSQMASTIAITFIPSADPAAAERQEITLRPGELYNADDVVEWLFGSLPPALRATGTMRFESDQPFAGWSRIFNQSSQGTYGQFVPLRSVSLTRLMPRLLSGKGVQVATSLAASSQLDQLFPVVENQQRRTNIGLTETSGKYALARLRIYDSIGEVLAIVDQPLGGFASVLRVGLLTESGLDEVDAMRAEVETLSGEGAVGSYISVVERSTGDAFFVTGE